jgi:nitrogen fixation protein FixH
MSNFRKNIWMYGIIASFVCFAAMMVGFAVYASRHKVTLVVNDYYKEEIEYQQKINKTHEVASLKERPTLIYKQDAQEVELSFPASVREMIPVGKVYFYRPNDSQQDFFVDIEFDNEGKQQIPVELLSNGKWKLKLDWQAEDRAFYIEKEIFIDNGKQLTVNSNQ